MTLDTSSFTDDLVRLVQEARAESTRLRHGYLATEHFVLAATRPGSIAIKLVRDTGVDADAVHHTLMGMIRPGESTPTAGFPLTSRTARAFVLASEVARDAARDRIGPGDLLVGLLREGLNPAAQALQYHGLTEESVIESLQGRGL